MIIHEREISQVMEAYDEGDNPLNLDKSLVDLYSGQYLHRYVAGRMIHALSGRDKNILGNVSKSLRIKGWNSLLGIDKITAHLMMAQRVHPLVLFWIATTAQSMAGLSNDDEEPFLSMDITKDYDDPDCLTTVSFKGDISWYSRRIAIMPSMPIAVINAAVGMPLSSLISHPVLDQYPMTIESFEHILANQDVVLSIKDESLREDLLLSIDAAERIRA